jgi:hypothetical protein
MKASDIFAILVVSLILTLLTLTGLRLDDEAQTRQQATWHIAE